jgi:hypothetical protein
VGELCTGEINGTNYQMSIGFWHFLDNPPLPVQLTSFSVIAIKNGVELNWQTTTEVNSYGFEIERRTISDHQVIQSSIDTWQKIGFVFGSGTSNAPKEYSYTDTISSAGGYVYRLKQIDQDGSFKYSHSVEVTTLMPKQYALSQNYPNPFNPETTINYDLPIQCQTTINIFNIMGQLVRTLNSKIQGPGYMSIKWNSCDENARSVSSGIYFYRLTISPMDGKAIVFQQTKKMLLVK